MTRDEAIEKLHGLLNEDEEVAHCAADEVLCELLEQEGFGDVVRAWRAVPKWYS